MFLQVLQTFQKLLVSPTNFVKFAASTNFLKVVSPTNFVKLLANSTNFVKLLANSTIFIKLFANFTNFVKFFSTSTNFVKLSGSFYKLIAQTVYNDHVLVSGPKKVAVIFILKYDEPPAPNFGKFLSI